METKPTVLTDRVNDIKEKMTQWQHIRSHKESYTLDELNIFRSVNMLIASYNTACEEKTKMDLIRLSYTSKQLSEIIDKIDMYTTGSTYNSDKPE